MSSREQTPRFHVGQKVRIIVCANGLPQHTGQFGLFVTQTSKRPTYRVSVDAGICQATEIEPVDENVPQEQIKGDL